MAEDASQGPRKLTPEQQRNVVHALAAWVRVTVTLLATGRDMEDDLEIARQIVSGWSKETRIGAGILVSKGDFLTQNFSAAVVRDLEAQDLLSQLDGPKEPEE